MRECINERISMSKLSNIIKHNSTNKRKSKKIPVNWHFAEFTGILVLFTYRRFTPNTLIRYVVILTLLRDLQGLHIPEVQVQAEEQPMLELRL